MEEEIEKNKDHHHIAPIYFPVELHRREALAQDLEYFYGEDWENQVSRKHMEDKYVSPRECWSFLALKLWLYRYHHPKSCI